MADFTLNAILALLLIAALYGVASAVSRIRRARWRHRIGTTGSVAQWSSGNIGGIQFDQFTPDGKPAVSADANEPRPDTDLPVVWHGSRLPADSRAGDWYSSPDNE